MRMVKMGFGKDEGQNAHRCAGGHTESVWI